MGGGVSKILLFSLFIISITSRIVWATNTDCFEEAGVDAGIDPDLLRVIAWHESGLNTHVEGDNALAGFKPGWGIGLMQIDTQHLSYLARYGINRQNLKTDICLNIYTGAYFLAVALNKTGNVWGAVGAYNAGFRDISLQESRRRKYAGKIRTLYKEYKSFKQQPGM